MFVQNDRAQARIAPIGLGNQLSETKPRPAIGDQSHIVTVDAPNHGSTVGDIDNGADRIGMGVIDVRGWKKGVEQRFD